MPAVSASDLVKLRTTRHATLLRLAVYKPAWCEQARVDGNQTTGDTTINMKGVVSSGITPTTDFLVKIGSTEGGEEYGTCRYRSETPTVLTVAQHNCALVDDAYITIIEEIKPSSKAIVVNDSDVILEDGDVAYTNQNTQFHPLARFGPPAVAYRDPTTGIATVNFYSNCTAIAAGATLASYLWTFPQGNPASAVIPGAVDALIPVEWSAAGQYYVSLTVTDSNGKTHTTYRPVFIFDRYSGTLPYTDVEINDMSGDVESGGWRASLRVLGDADSTEFPPEALVVVFADDWYGTEQTSIGGQWSYRENIVFVGYIARGTTKKDWVSGAVEFEVEGIGTWLDSLPGLAETLEDSAAPTGWHQLKDMTLNLGAFHLLTEHSTIPEIADVYLNLPTYLIDFIDLTESGLRSQVDAACCRPARGRVGSSAQGVLYLEPNPQLLPTASRTMANVLTTTLADMREIDLGDESTKKNVSQIDFCGETATGDPYFSLAPALPWESAQSERVDGIRADSQVESNSLAGLFEAYRNNQFADVHIRWRGDYRVFDVYPNESIQVTLTAAQNLRGIVWTSQKCWHKRVSYNYSPGILLAETIVERDSYGALGVTGDYPTTPPTPTPPPPAPIDPLPDPPEPNTPGPDDMPGDGSRVYVATDKGVAICDNFLTSPTWTAVNTGLSGDALDVFRFLFDPWSSSGSTLTGAYVATKDGIYKGAGLPSPTWTKVLSAATLIGLIGANDAGDPTACQFTREIVLPINVQNHVGIIARKSLAGGRHRHYYVYSNNGGTSWACSTSYYWDVGNPVGWSWNLTNTSGVISMFAFPSHKTANKIYLSVGVNNTWDGTPAHGVGLVTSTDGGVTWGAAQDWEWLGTVGPRYIVLPFANGSGTPYANDLKAWACHGENPDYEILTSTSFPGPGFQQASTWTLAHAFGTNVYSWLMDINTWDEDYVYIITAHTTTPPYALVYTNDGGSNWATQSLAHVYELHSLSALPYNPLFLAVATAATDDGNTWVYRTLDGGANFVDATGDLDTALASITAVRSIVPDWIKVT